MIKRLKKRKQTIIVPVKIKKEQLIRRKNKIKKVYYEKH